MAYVTETDLEDYLQIAITPSSWATKVIAWSEAVVNAYCGTSWTTPAPVIISLVTMRVAARLVQQGEAHWEEKMRDRVDSSPAAQPRSFEWLTLEDKQWLAPYVLSTSVMAKVMRNIKMSRPSDEDDVLFDVTT